MEKLLPRLKKLKEQKLFSITYLKKTNFSKIRKLRFFFLKKNSKKCWTAEKIKNWKNNYTELQDKKLK